MILSVLNTSKFIQCIQTLLFKIANTELQLLWLIIIIIDSLSLK